MSLPNDRPFRKVVDGVTAKIANGEYAERSALPSVAKLASDYDVSVGTVDRAILILEDRRLIYGKRGKARYVSDGARERARTRLAEDGQAGEVPGADG